MSNGSVFGKDASASTERAQEQNTVVADDSLAQRSALGKKVIESQRATGKPGEKQPTREDNLIENEQVVGDINKLIDQLGSETKPSSAEKSKMVGNINKTPPEDRTLANEKSNQTQALNAAAGHLAAARTAYETQVTSDARLTSDPRHERDQKIYELGQAGKLGLVPPAPEEVATAAARTGVPASIAQEIPTTPQEQVDRDMARLKVAEERSTAIETGINPTVDAANRGAEVKHEVNTKMNEPSQPLKPSTLTPAVTESGQVRESARTSEANTPNDPANTTASGKAGLFTKE